MTPKTNPDQADIIAANERLAADLSTLTAERDTLKASLATANTERDTAKAALQTVAAERDTLKTENQTLKAENTALKGKESDFNKAVAGQVAKFGIDNPAPKAEASSDKKLSATEKVLKAKGAASLAELAAKK
jgi:chromosome segregation ATPase